jgi:hypothetical protein
MEYLKDEALYLEEEEELVDEKERKENSKFNYFI